MTVGRTGLSRRTETGEGESNENISHTSMELSKNSFNKKIVIIKSVSIIDVYIHSK